MEFLFDNGERGKERERQREAWKERGRGVTEREGYRDREISLPLHLSETLQRMKQIELRGGVAELRFKGGIPLVFLTLELTRVQRHRSYQWHCRRPCPRPRYPPRFHHHHRWQFPSLFCRWRHLAHSQLAALNETVGEAKATWLT